MALKTYRYTSVWLKNSFLFIIGWFIFTSAASAQGILPKDTLEVELSDSLKIIKPKEKKPRLIAGVSVGVDLVGLGMKIAGAEWSLMEVMARIHLKDKFFPIAELGIGEAEHEGHDLDNRFKVRAPYFRVGIDYNFTKKNNGNRLLVGARYGFSAYNYDLTSPVELTDPVWNVSKPFDYSYSGSAHWAEIVLGLETRLWKFIHLGWDARIKFRIKQKLGENGQAWFIPGYGKNDTTWWGGSFKVLFEL